MYEDLDLIRKKAGERFNLAVSSPHYLEGRGRQREAWAQKSLALLGDKVLDMILVEFFFHQGKTNSEMHFCYVSFSNKAHLKKVGLAIGLPKVMKLSPADLKEEHWPRVVSETVEAIIAAIYLAHGYKAAREFVLEYVLSKEEEG